MQPDRQRQPGEPPRSPGARLPTSPFRASWSWRLTRSWRQRPDTSFALQRTDEGDEIPAIPGGRALAHRGHRPAACGERPVDEAVAARADRDVSQVRGGRELGRDRPVAASLAPVAGNAVDREQLSAARGRGGIEWRGRLEVLVVLTVVESLDA